MFDKNDRFLRITSIFLKVSIWFLSIAGSLAFIILAAEDLVGAAFIVLCSCAILAFMTWVYGNLLLSFICDVKLIRNKLYNVNNSNTDIYLSDEDKYKIFADAKQKMEKAKRLKELLDNNVITKEEYDAEMEKLK